MRLSPSNQIACYIILLSIVAGRGRGQNLTERVTLPEQMVGVWSLAVSPDGRMLATGMQSGEVRLWEIVTGKERAVLRGHDHGVVSLAFSPDGKLLASGGRDKVVKIWDIAKRKNTASWAPDGSSDGKKIASKLNFNDVSAVLFSPDGKTLVTGSQDKIIRIWDVTFGKKTATLRGHSEEVTSLAISPDGKTLASAGGDIKLWDMEPVKEKDLPAGFVSEARCITYSPDGKSLAVGSEKLVQVWDVAQAKVTATLRGHKTVVCSVAFSSDGKRLASCGEGELGVENPGEVRLWSLAKDGSLIASQEHNGHLNWVMFASDDKVLISGGPLHVTLWNAPRIEVDK